MFVAMALAVSSPALAEDTGFQSPSGNIRCLSSVYDGVGEVRCDIGNFTPTLRRPRDCDLDFGGAFWITATGRRGRALCHGDSVGGRGFPILGYGESWSGNGVTCVSNMNGMRCTNRAGHGFHIARARQRLF